VKEKMRIGGWIAFVNVDLDVGMSSAAAGQYSTPTNWVERR
jgi:hypothetical protein